MPATLTAPTCATCDQTTFDPECFRETVDGDVCRECAAEYVACDDCGETAARSEAFPQQFCDACAGQYVTCAACEDIGLRHGSYDEYCEACGNERCTCEDCGGVVLVDETMVVNDSVVCEQCFGRNYFTCAGCDEPHHDTICAFGPNSERYCEDCWCEHFGTCENCECVRPLGELDEYGCCPSCGRWYDAETFRRRTSECTRAGSLRTFGVELETSTCGNQEDLRGGYFGAKHDGSIDGPEFVSSVLSGDEGLRVVESFCDDVDGSVNRDCGYHLHIGVADLTHEQLTNVARAYLAYESVWQSFVPAARRRNSYCPPLGDAFKQYLDNGTPFCNFPVSRYQWFNVTAYARHGTFEIRLHPGTLNKRKVVNWVRAHLRFVGHFANVSNTVPVVGSHSSLYAIWKSTGAADLSEFYEARRKRFADNGEESADSAELEHDIHNPDVCPPGYSMWCSQCRAWY